MHGHGTPQMAFVSGGHLGQDVTLERLATLDGATGTHTKALFRAALGLHFGHCMLPWVVLARCPNCQVTAAGPATGAWSGTGLATGFFLPGAIIMIIWRPSSLGNCSTMMTSANSSRMRLSNARPSSWCVISRPRKRSVILHLSPSARKRRMLRILMW